VPSPRLVFDMTAQQKLSVNEPCEGEEVHVQVSSQRIPPSYRGHALDMENRDPTSMNDHIKVESRSLLVVHCTCTCTRQRYSMSGELGGELHKTWMLSHACMISTHACMYACLRASLLIEHLQTFVLRRFDSACECLLKNAMCIYDIDTVFQLSMFKLVGVGGVGNGKFYSCSNTYKKPGVHK